MPGFAELDRLSSPVMERDRVWCKPTVAVDLDMTLTAEPWTSHDHIADPAPHSRRVLERFAAAGWQIIIYTCRPDCHMVKQWHQRHYPGLIEGINFNPDEAMTSRCILQKPYANIYLDDRAWPLRGDVPVDWLAVERDMEARGIFRSDPEGGGAHRTEIALRLR